MQMMVKKPAIIHGRTRLLRCFWEIYPETLKTLGYALRTLPSRKEPQLILRMYHLEPLVLTHLMAPQQLDCMELIKMILQGLTVLTGQVT